MTETTEELIKRLTEQRDGWKYRFEEEVKKTEEYRKWKDLNDAVLFVDCCNDYGKLVSLLLTISEKLQNFSVHYDD